MPQTILQYYKEKQSDETRYGSFYSSWEKWHWKIYPFISTNIRNFLRLIDCAREVNRVTWHPFTESEVEEHKQKVKPLKYAKFFTWSNSDWYNITEAWSVCLNIGDSIESKDEQWILLYLLMLSYWENENVMDIFDKTYEHINRLNRFISKDQVLDKIKSLLSNSWIDKSFLFSTEIFRYLSFAYDQQFIEIFKNSSDADKTRLYQDVTSRSERDPDLIVKKFKPSWNFNVQTFIDESIILYLTSLIILNRFNDFNSFVDFIVDKYSEIRQINKARVLSFITRNRSVYMNVYNLANNYINNKIWVLDQGNSIQNNSSSTLSSNNTNMIPLNTILYWVPGTWKTYNTINYAVAIIEGKTVDEVKAESDRDRESVKKRYEAYVKKWQIVFTTFHQSYWYEDFIEGIKASVEDWNVDYSVEPWTFKELCDRASINDNFDDVYNKFLEDIADEEEPFQLQTSTWKTFWVMVNSKNNLNLYTWPELRSNWVITKSNLQRRAKGDDTVFTGWESYSKWIINYFESEYDYASEVGNTNNYVMIIDEINRWNISKIFWELITLLEPDKRIWGEEEITVTLPYSHEEFWIPKNIYVLWTMNTADRSIALIDLALRRRFHFVEIEPDSSLLEWIDAEWVDVKALFETINERIEFLYDRDHLIWHAYFFPLRKEPTLKKLNSIIYDKIIPLLQEYFHDEWEKIQIVLWENVIISKEVPALTALWGNNYEMEDKIKYYVNNDISASDYSIN